MSPEVFRNQFYFGPSRLDGPEGFVRSNAGTSGTLVAHRDLQVATVSDADGFTILLGFCFDIASPPRTLQQICETLHAQEIDALARATDDLAGRWVLIKKDSRGAVALSDAAGTFPLCHLATDDGVAIASSSRLIAAMHPGRQPNPLITKAFADKQATPGRHAGFSFPLTATSFADVFALPPNHRLCLSTGGVRRFFPDAGGYGTRRGEDMVGQIAETIRRVMQAASLHHDLDFAATGGFDSLLLQSAISSIEGLARKTQFFTFQYPGDPKAAHTDISNAQRSTRIIGAPHRVIPATGDAASRRITEICRLSEEFHATGFEGWVEALEPYAAADRLVIMGWASEIARGFYRWAGSEQVEAYDLMCCAGLQGHEELAPVFESWIRDAAAAAAVTGLPVLDLFYWENRVGRWCGPGLNILNTGANWISPFSCRALLRQMLAVRERDRVGRRQRLYRDLIGTLEPRLSGVTPNPMTLRESLDYTLRVDLRDFVLKQAIRLKIDSFLRRKTRRK